jgi:hypothetical protein
VTSQPQPDDKDWTWVLSETCPDCGFDAPSIAPEAIAALTRDAVSGLAAALHMPGADVRPAPRVWSTLEYGCHVRDVCVLFEARLGRMLDEDDPVFENWDQDETALAQRYWEQEPRAVAAQLRRSGEVIAERFASVTEAEWQRPSRRSNGSRFTVESFGRYFLHDLVHHLHDVSGSNRPDHPAE